MWVPLLRERDRDRSKNQILAPGRKRCHHSSGTWTYLCSLFLSSGLFHLASLLLSHDLSQAEELEAIHSQKQSHILSRATYFSPLLCMERERLNWFQKCSQGLGTFVSKEKDSQTFREHQTQSKQNREILMAQDRSKLPYVLLEPKGGKATSRRSTCCTKLMCPAQQSNSRKMD